MKTFIQPGDVVTVVAPATTVSGQGVLVGDMFGVALTGAASGVNVEIAVTGVVTLPKAAGTINPGVRVFWDNTAGNVTTTATDNRCIGWHGGLAANSGGAATAIIVRLGAPNAVAA